MAHSEIRAIKGGGIMFAGGDAVELFRAVTIKHALMMIEDGIVPGRGWTKTKTLKAVKRYTGKDYRRGEIPRAIRDLDVWIELMKSALPVVGEDKP